MRTLTFPRPVLPCALLLCTLVMPVFGEAVLELDFRNFDETARTVTPIEMRPGTSSALPLSEINALVEPATPTGIASGNDALTTGFLDVWFDAEGGFLATSKDISDEPGRFATYLGPDGFSAGTVAVVFQPRFNGPLTGESASQRSYLFANNVVGTAKQAVQLAIGRDLTMSFGMGNIEPPVQRVTLEQPNWDSSKWYFIAASWSPGIPPILYWREIGSKKGFFAQAPDPLVNTDVSGLQNLIIGNVGSNQSDVPGNSPMNGKMAFFRLADDSFATEADFESLYDTIVQPK